MQKNLANLSLTEAERILAETKSFIDGSNGSLSNGLKKKLVGDMSSLRKKVELRKKELKLGKTDDEIIPVNKTNLGALQALLP